MSCVGKSPRLLVFLGFFAREITSIFWQHWLYEPVMCVFRQLHDEINISRIVVYIFPERILIVFTLHIPCKYHLKEQERIGNGEHQYPL